MILSDATIKQYITENKIKLLPWAGETLEEIWDNIVCASFDMRLANGLKIFPHLSDYILDPFHKDTQEITEHLILKDDEEYILHPGTFILWATKERVGVPDNLVARVEGRSSMARLGLLVHITWWFIDPGFGRDEPSTITLEIRNINSVPIVLRPNMRICQLAFETMDQPAAIPYNKKKTAKYNGQQAPTESRFHISN